MTDRFLKELARSGLILEAGASSFFKDGEYVLTVIAQDDEAIDEKNMNYDTRKVLEKLIKNCGTLPKVGTNERLEYPAHCVCRKPSYFVLQSPPEWEGTPVKCGDCGKSVPLYRLDNSVPEREFDDLLMWRRLRRGCFSTYESGRHKQSIAYAQSQSDAAAAYAVLKSCTSDLSLEGRRLAGIIESKTGILTLYPLFSHYERLPEHCPQCGGDWHNQYTYAVNYECFCRACRLVM